MVTTQPFGDGKSKWRHWPDVADIFDGPLDLEWERDRALVSQFPADPFAA